MALKKPRKNLGEPHPQERNFLDKKPKAKLKFLQSHPPLQFPSAILPILPRPILSRPLLCVPLSSLPLTLPPTPTTLRHHDPHDAPRPVDRLLAHRTRHRRRRQPLLAPHAHRQVVARHVQHAALLVHAHDAEVAVVGGVELGLVGLVGGFLEVFLELLLDLEEGWLAGARGAGGRWGSCLLYTSPSPRD